MTLGSAMAPGLRLLRVCTMYSGLVHALDSHRIQHHGHQPLPRISIMYESSTPVTMFPLQPDEGVRARHLLHRWYEGPYILRDGYISRSGMCAGTIDRGSKPCASPALSVPHCLSLVCRPRCFSKDNVHILITLC